MSYNNRIENNNIDLQAILNIVKNLPEESGGIELPELTNEGSAADLLAGKELIDSDGNVIEGTMPDHGDLGGSITIDTENYYYDIPAGYHNGDGSVNMRLEEKTVTPIDTKQIITPSVGCVLSKVIVEAASGGGASGGTCSVEIIVPAGVCVFGWGTCDQYVSANNGSSWISVGTGLTMPGTGSDAHKLPIYAKYVFANLAVGSVFTFYYANGINGASVSGDIEFGLANHETYAVQEYLFGVCRCNGDGTITVEV